MRFSLQQASLTFMWTVSTTSSFSFNFTPRSLGALSKLKKQQQQQQQQQYHSSSSFFSFSCTNNKHNNDNKSHNKIPNYMTQLFGGVDGGGVDGGGGVGGAVGHEEKDPGVVEGTDLRIVQYPHPALRAENAEITVEELKDKDNTEIADLAKQMLKVMYAAEGVGLAAPQVGANQRLMVYNASGDSKKWLEETILVNPQIIEFSEAQETDMEGCLSFPDMSGEVTRSKWIKVQAMNLRGKTIKKKYTGWEARIFQHEYDHLDGTVYTDRLNEEELEKVQPRLNELIADFGDGGVV